MVQEQVCTYDKQAEALSLQWAAETSPSSYQDRLLGIQRDISSFQNEQANEYAYWSGTYTLGVDGHGNSALVTPEIAIPGRVHRNDSHAMVDSMVGNAVYVSSQIEKGNMPHEAWDIAREQLKQFRAIQETVLQLSDNESFLGFAMNGATTRDGVALLQITRKENVFLYETRLIGGLSEGAAHAVLSEFVSDVAKPIFLKEHTTNPLYIGVQGKLRVDLDNQQKITGIVQHILDERGETKIQTVFSGMCRSVEKPIKTDDKNIEKKDGVFIGKQHEYTIAPFYHKQSDEFSNVDISSYAVFSHPYGSASPVYSPMVPETIQEMKRMETKETRTPEAKTHARVETEHSQTREDGIYPELTSAVRIEEISPPIFSQQEMKETDDLELSSLPLPEHAVVQTQIEMPFATCIMKAENQSVSKTREKVLTIAVSSSVQLHAGQTECVKEMFSEQFTVHAPHAVQVEGESVVEVDMIEAHVPLKRERTVVADAYLAVDHIRMQDLNVFVTNFETQLAKGMVRGEVKKLVWMETNDQAELVPVEEVEIVQDTARTIHNLLHFLRKIVHAYSGDDVIRERNIQRIATDSSMCEVEELEAYIHLLQASRFHGRMFAMVS